MTAVATEPIQARGVEPTGEGATKREREPKTKTESESPSSPSMSLLGVVRYFSLAAAHINVKGIAN